MPDLTATEIASLSWCDANYEGYRWQSNTETPTLILYLVSNDEPSSILSCSWACRLTVDLAYDNHVGPLLTRDATFQPLPDCRWAVHVELPPNGYIKFECNDLRLVSADRIAPREEHRTDHDTQSLLRVLTRCRELVADSEDSDWACMGVPDVLHSLDEGLAAVSADSKPDINDLKLLFLPTGPLQETSMSNNWSDEFLALSSEFDQLIVKW